MHYNNNLVRQFVCVLLLSLVVFAPMQAQQEDNVRVHIATLDSQLSDIVWCGNNKGNGYNVLVLTIKGTVYRSSDRGNTWESMTTMMQRSAVKLAKDINIKWGYVSRIRKS
jgi:hypothetical protein